jgi:HAD superfamily hydrolase (TIGR01490 family)
MIAAFFDVDFTLLPTTSVERLFIRQLWRCGGLEMRDLIRAGVSILSASSSSSEGLKSQTPVPWIKSNKAYLAGKSAADLEALVKPFILEVVFPRLSPKAIETVEWHRRQEHTIVLLTGSLDLLMRPLADHLGITVLLCTRLEQHQGVYTGRWVPPYPYGEGKRILLEQFARSNGVDLIQSYAYGDSLSDLPMLSAVGHPRVVNAGWRMRRLAERRGWTQLRW